MCPRPYAMGKRLAARSQTRTRILEAAREILASEPATDLSMEAIARRANVSRLTIYYQFKSRPGLLESLYDHLAMRGKMQAMAEVFKEPDPWPAIEKLIRTFANFWSSDSLVIRRLRAMAGLDAEIAQGIAGRDARRGHILREILKRRVMPGRKTLAPAQQNLAADVLSMLTSFETYDTLARAGYDQTRIVTTITLLARSLMNQFEERGSV